MSLSARGVATLVLALGILSAAAPRTPAVAQEVTFTGRADPQADRRILAILAAGQYRLLARDTTIPAGDTLRGPVLAAGIRLRLNGAVAGDLVGVASDIFVHPTGSVTGELVNAGGGLYASSLARIGETVDRPLAAYTITRADGALHIQASTPGHSAIALDGLRGLHIPTYDRVDGLWLEVGAGLHLPRPPALDSARIHVVAGWRTGGPGLSHTVDLQVQRGRFSAAVGEQVLSTTQDRWIRGDLVNSLAFLTVGNDSRDYYEARRLFALLAQDYAAGRWSGYAALRLLREDAASLRARDPFVLFKPDTVRPNPLMGGRIASVGLEAGASWTGIAAAYGLTGEVEAAGSALSGDFSFARYALGGQAAVQALWGHTLVVEARVQGPLPGSATLPRQRWSQIGGPATLPTFPIAAFAGDHVVFFSEQYVVPLPSALHLPLLGTPALALVHATGVAWTGGSDQLPVQDHPLEQNLGLELRVIGLALSAYADPAHARSTARFGAGFSLGTGRRSGAALRFDMAAAER